MPTGQLFVECRAGAPADAIQDLLDSLLLQIVESRPDGGLIVHTSSGEPAAAPGVRITGQPGTLTAVTPVVFVGGSSPGTTSLFEPLAALGPTRNQD